MLLALTNLYGDVLGLESKRTTLLKSKDFIPVYDTDDLSIEDCKKAKITRAYNLGITIENLVFEQKGSKKYFYEKHMPIKVLSLSHGVRIAFLGEYVAYEYGDYLHIGRYGNVVTFCQKEVFALVTPPVLEDGKMVTRLYTIAAGRFLYYTSRPIENSGGVYRLRPKALSQLLRTITLMSDDKEIRNYIKDFSKME